MEDKEYQRTLQHLQAHRIELDTTIPPTYQNWYRMNPNYVVVVKHDLNKLLTTRFIVPMDETTWFPPIVVLLKKNGNLYICVDFKRLNATIYEGGLRYGSWTQNILIFGWIFLVTIRS
jgi:hypothetical protein